VKATIKPCCAVLLVVVWSSVAAEPCKYAIENARGGVRTLTQTENYFLLERVPINSTSATVSASRIEIDDPAEVQRYLSVIFLAYEFAETEQEARSLLRESTVTKDFPLIVFFADDSSLLLPSTGMLGGPPAGPTVIAAPGEWGNDTDRFRVLLVFHGSYRLDDELIEALTAKPVKALQITTLNGDFDAKVSPSRANRIQLVIGCV
jgi:hypothetical protein